LTREAEENDNDDGKESDRDKGVRVDALTITQLKARLRNLGLKGNGDKKKTCERGLRKLSIKIAMRPRTMTVTRKKRAQESKSHDTTRADESERNGAAPISEHRQPIFTFKDVEDALETFSGDNGENIRR